MAGCIALYMQATQIRDSATILTRLTNYANPTLTTVGNQGEYINSPIKQGSGLVQVKKMATAANFFEIKLTYLVLRFIIRSTVTVLLHLI